MLGYAPGSLVTFMWLNHLTCMWTLSSDCSQTSSSCLCCSLFTSYSDPSYCSCLSSLWSRAVILSFFISTAVVWYSPATWIEDYLRTLTLIARTPPAAYFTVPQKFHSFSERTDILGNLHSCSTWWIVHKVLTRWVFGLVFFTIAWGDSCCGLFISVLGSWLGLWYWRASCRVMATWSVVKVIVGFIEGSNRLMRIFGVFDAFFPKFK